MSALNRTVSTTDHLGKHRPLVAADTETAKAQAYLMRDLLKQHAGVRLTGGDVTDAFALTYHGADWSTLMATRRKTPGTEPYYGAQRGQVMSQFAYYLSRLTGAPSQGCIRVLCDMPRAEYSEPRTMAGALLATLLAGKPSWHLPNLGQGFPNKPLNGLSVNQQKADALRVFDARTDRGYLVRHFRSDPLTNAEQLVGYDWRTREEVVIPIECVRFTRFKRLPGEPAQTYVLTDHAMSEATARAFYDKGHALNYELARHWYNAGNDLSVMVSHSGGKNVRTELSTWNPEGANDFDVAMRGLREFYGMGNVVLLPKGLAEVRHPDERWAPSFKHVRALLPEVEAADRAYHAQMDAIVSTATAADAEARISAAVRAYNETLLRAAEAYWLDTREINGRDNIMQFCRVGCAELGDQLLISEVSPLQALRDMIGLNPDGSEKTKAPAGAASDDRDLLEKRIGMEWD